MKITEDVLIKVLTNQNLEAKSQKETNQIYFTIEHEKQKFPSFIRPLHEGNLLQIMVFIPTLMEKQGMTNVARFLHLANKELDMPGFGMDENTQTVFYRIVIPTIKQAIDENLFKAYIQTCKDVCVTFAVVIQALSMGLMSMEDIMNQLSKQPTSSKK